MVQNQDTESDFIEVDYTEFIAAPRTEELVERSWPLFLSLYLLIPFLLCVALGIIIPIGYGIFQAYNEAPAVERKPTNKPRVTEAIVANQAFQNFQENSQRILRGHYRLVNALAISPDSRILLSGEGEKQYAPQADFGLDRSMIPDNESLPLTSTNTPDYYGLYVWDLAVTRPQRVITEHKSPISALTFSNNGQMAASVDIKGHFILWNVQDWTIYDEFSAVDRQRAGLGSLQSLNCVSFSPNGDFIAIGGAYLPSGRSAQDSLSRQGLVIMWDIKQKKEKFRNDNLVQSEPFYALPTGTDGVQSLAFTRDGMHLFATLTGSASGVYILDNTGEITPVLDVNKIRSSTLHAIPGAQQLPQYSSGHDSPPSTFLKAALRFDDRRIAAGDNHGRVSLWEFSPDKKEPLEKMICIDYARPFENLDRNIRDIRFSRDGKYLVSCGEELAIRNGNTDKLNVLGFLTPDGDGAYRDKPYYAYSLVFSPDGHYLIAGCSDAMIRIWEMKTLPAIWRAATTLDIENQNKVFDAGQIEEVNELEFRPRKKK